ncbi:UDP-N-acetylglucosamine 1-carboxyvinyltransferase [Candidatus Peregrinibacteria bacterium CG10_big_fil_rev_8_21_14_0_10_36_19]|nr:MAG: UDP-N-acetylglucosamine 1-carboxyvinyltransferase [Candidatus Peregrinibacteria bacterium CG10_big_fil_rev_8_21_14_0_10_36_19]
MPKFIVQGGRKLQGTVKISGSKNAVLPIICASLLAEDKTTLTNVPDIADVHSMLKIVESLGAKVNFENDTVEIIPGKLKKNAIPDELINRMRASILIIGPLIPLLGEVKMPFPGGCVLGKRSVDTHTYAFKKLGCKIIEEKKYIHITSKKLKGTKIILPELSVTATENAIMAAVLAEGETEIRLAAAEPHVQDLCIFLQKMGAKIEGIGTNNIKIKGVKKLKGAKHSITGDYLEAGTFAIAAVGTKGDVKITGIDPGHLDSFWQKLEEMGVKFTLGKDYAHIHPYSGNLQPVTSLKTAVYPSFATDLQAPFTVLLTQAKGVSKVFETLFEGRLSYLFELEKMGAHIEFLNAHQALIIGKSKLKGSLISSCDIRAGAAMVVAALIAEGETEISNIRYIDRGYEKLEDKFNALGASIKRIQPKD